MKKLLGKSPKDRYFEELQTGGLNVNTKLTQYFYNTYIKPNYSQPARINELRMGQIYTYLYDPKHKDTLAYYDTNPMTLIYGSWYAKDGTYLYNGVNLHFLPANMKLAILDVYWKYFYRFGGSKIMSILPFTYTKMFLTVFEKMNGINYKFALRTYITSRIANPLQVPETDWGKIPFAKPTFIKGKTLDDIYNEYYSKK